MGKVAITYAARNDGRCWRATFEYGRYRELVGRENIVVGFIGEGWGKGMKDIAGVFFCADLGEAIDIIYRHKLAA